MWIKEPSTKMRFKVEGCGKCHGLGCITSFTYEGKRICANCIDQMLGSGNYDLDVDTKEVVKIRRNHVKENRKGRGSY